MEVVGRQQRQPQRASRCSSCYLAHLAAAAARRMAPAGRQRTRARTAPACHLAPRPPSAGSGAWEQRPPGPAPKERPPPLGRPLACAVRRGAWPQHAIVLAASLAPLADGPPRGAGLIGEVAASTRMRGLLSARAAWHPARRARRRGRGTRMPAAPPLRGFERPRRRRARRSSADPSKARCLCAGCSMRHLCLMADAARCRGSARR
jgi:hypothetical protein